MYSFGKKSKRVKAECVMPLQNVADMAIELINFSLVTGKRERGEQNKLYDRNLTKVRWPDSYHNVLVDSDLSEAFDFYPWVPGVGAITAHPDQIAKIAKEYRRDTDQIRVLCYTHFAYTAGIIMACGDSLGHHLTWGGNWDGDDSFFDQKFYDLPHVQIELPGGRHA